MTSVNEGRLIRRWIYSVLSGDTTVTDAIGLRLYRRVVPEGAIPVPNDDGTPGPVWGILYDRHAGLDNLSGFGERISVDQRYQIKAICQGDTDTPVAGLADSIERLFNGVRQTQYGDLMIVSCTREDMIEYSNNDEGVTWNYNGGMYRIFAYYNPIIIPPASTGGSQFPDAAPGQFPDAV